MKELIAEHKAVARYIASCGNSEKCDFHAVMRCYERMKAAHEKARKAVGK